MTQLTIYRCAFCGNHRPSGRADMQYCSHSCKMKAYRWRQRMSRYETQTFKNITDLASYIDYPQTKDEAIKRLSTIIDTVKHLAAQHNVIIKSVR